MRRGRLGAGFDLPAGALTADDYDGPMHRETGDMADDIAIDRDTLAMMRAELDDTLMWCRTFVFGSGAAMAVSYGMQDGWDMVVTIIVFGYIGILALMLGTINLISYQEHKRELAWKEAQ